MPLGGSQPFIPFAHLMEKNKINMSESQMLSLDTSKNSNLNSNDVSSISNGVKKDEILYKTGYLFKRAMRTRMGKSWLKRKCAAENGVFLIYHSDVLIYY